MSTGGIEEIIEDEATKLVNYLKVNATDLDGVEPDVFDEDPFFKDPLDFFEDEPGCKVLLFQTLGRSNVRIMDLLLFIPNLIFFVYLMMGLNKGIRRISGSNAPVYRAFYYLILGSASFSLARCILSIILGMVFSYSHALDELGWILLHYVLITTEISVVVLGITQIDSLRSIRRIVFISSLIATFYSIVQAVLELKFPDPSFHFKGMNLFGFGGSFFLFFSSILFLLFYAALLILPCLTPCHKYVWALPQKRSFYYYSTSLLLLNLFQIMGTLLLIYNPLGLCFLNASIYLYFTLLIPIIYITFLRGFFKTAQPSLLFSYKAQVDDENRQSELNEGGKTNEPIIINSRLSQS
ncbi:transmembrane protein adipocyte-associated 1 homolog [Lepeophtheirus salmonis]|uniref:Integral membrane protein GPR175 n=2 Tax=Lepeophtheirus salmonis TaxID=72036 RepID=C1BUH1_LEPSM|nr:transmembrane protein adipocyte-associated 1 homolog [Lepeophtheirus salmonis]ACO12674.1 Integral membrane protein GPR175 [Lepeophtheirus salmonis]ADD24536.1 Transmembrane protein adipocyte-associated 1 [Lepeophtheirus salmonis]